MQLTFAELDRAKGYPELAPATEEEFPLPAWYRQVYRTPIEKLTVFDVCRACQQRIHVEHVVPLALRFLAADILAGERYDGEIISSLINLPADYWAAHPSEVSEVIRYCADLRANRVDEIGRELVSGIEQFLQKQRERLSA